MPRSNVGRDWMSDRLFRINATAPTEAQIIALSEIATAIPSPNTWDDFGGAPGNEMTADGFARGLGTYSHTAGTQTSTLQRTFTHTGPSGGGTARTPRKVAVFAQANGGTIPGAADSGIGAFHMDQPNPPTLTGTDSLNQTVSFDMGT